MDGLFLLLLGGTLALFAWIGRTRAIAIPPGVDAWLTSSRWAAVVAGIVPALFTWFVWGSLNESGIFHDERAYLLQARIFAEGTWTGTPPPLATFFEQMHVFIDPQLAAKYPPGHALLLVPGVWLGQPGLVPVLLVGLSGALVFVIARRVVGTLPALAGWALWATSASSLRWRASYFSETTSGLLWLVSLWALLRWRDDRRWYHLAIICSATAFMYLTRPLTALALGLPLGLVILWDLSRNIRLWRGLAVAVLLSVPILALDLVWHERTRGAWFTNPYAEYSRLYAPFDKPGFGVDSSPPTRDVPEEIAWVGREFLDIHRDHQPLALPLILFRRTIVLLLLLGQHTMFLLTVLFVAGARRSRGPVLFALASMASLVIAYLVFAHPPGWIVYYFEVFPVFYVVACAEAVRFATALTGHAARARAIVALVLAMLSPWLLENVWQARRLNDTASTFHRTANRLLATLPREPAIVFVHYPAQHNFHLSLVTNTPDYRTAPLWLVYDRAENNAQLLKLTDRAAYRLDVASWTLQELRSGSAGSIAGVAPVSRSTMSVTAGSTSSIQRGRGPGEASIGNP